MFRERIRIRAILFLGTPKCGIPKDPDIISGNGVEQETRKNYQGADAGSCAGRIFTFRIPVSRDANFPNALRVRST